MYAQPEGSPEGGGGSGEGCPEDGVVDADFEEVLEEDNKDKPNT